MHKTLIVTTGGTIESFYNPEEGTPATVPQTGQSYIPEAIAELKRSGAIPADFTFYHYPLGQHDSKQVTREHMQHIAYYLHQHPEYEKVMIVHGTDTMPVHARLLKKYLHEFGIDNRTVVFTGAMEPLRDKERNPRPSADGWKNLAYTIHHLPRMLPGVSVVMDEIRYNAEEINKLVETEDAKPGTEIMVKHSEFIPRDMEKANIPLTPLG